MTSEVQQLKNELHKLIQQLQELYAKRNQIDRQFLQIASQEDTKFNFYAGNYKYEGDLKDFYCRTVDQLKILTIHNNIFVCKNAKPDEFSNLPKGINLHCDQILHYAPDSATAVYFDKFVQFQTTNQYVKKQIQRDRKSYK